jgi:DNA-binding transcriptional MocR family regulator
MSEGVWSSVWMSSPLGAEIANLWLEDGTLERMVRLRCDEMDARHRIAARVLDGMGARTRARAYQLWLPLAEGLWDGQSLAAALLREGVRVSAAEEFRADARPVPGAIRISLSASSDRKALERALRTLRRVVETGPSPTTRI